MFQARYVCLNIRSLNKDTWFWNWILLTTHRSEVDLPAGLYDEGWFSVCDFISQVFVFSFSHSGHIASSSLIPFEHCKVCCFPCLINNDEVAVGKLAAKVLASFSWYIFLYTLLFLWLWVWLMCESSFIACFCELHWCQSLHFACLHFPCALKYGALLSEALIYEELPYCCQIPNSCLFFSSCVNSSLETTWVPLQQPGRLCPKTLKPSLKPHQYVGSMPFSCYY